MNSNDPIFKTDLASLKLKNNGFYTRKYLITRNPLANYQKQNANARGLAGGGGGGMATAGID